MRKEKRARLCIKMAEQLNKNPPASEVWFHKKFNEEKIKRIYGCYKKGKFIDMCNEPFFDYYIPDIVNHGYRYIIEVDGEIHNNLKQAYKDLAKDQYYRKRHYKVFRVKAYDDESYNKFIVEFKEYLDKLHSSSHAALLKKIEESPNKEIHLCAQLIQVVDQKPPKVFLEPGKPKVILRKANNDPQ